MLMSKYRYILFDLDETILDFKKTEQFALRGAVSDFGMESSPEIEELYSNVNKSLWLRFEKGEITREELKRMRFETVFGGPGRNIDGLAMNQSYMDHMSQTGFFIPGAESFLEKLSKTDLRLFIITNGLSYTQNGRIREAGLARFVEKVFISEEMGRVKPDPEYTEMVIDYVGDSDRSKYLVVGDSLSSDIMLAENSGMDCCLFAAEGKTFPAGYELHDITYKAKGYDELMAVICQ